MGILPTRFLEVYAKAITGGAEVTLEGLISDLELHAVGHTLEQIRIVVDTVAECRLELIPAITSGDLNTTRLLRPPVQPSLAGESAMNEILRGESSTQEFKSSLVYNHKRATAQPGTPVIDLQSDEVTFSCLRTIAAFLSSLGGVLYVGVDDQADLVGIEYDFQLLAKGMGNRDSWELYLRNLVQGRFKEGVSVNDYVTVGFGTVDGKTLARIAVLRRSRLSLLRKADGCYALFRRQGNRSVEVKIEAVEEFLELRRTQSNV